MDAVAVHTPQLPTNTVGHLRVRQRHLLLGVVVVIVVLVRVLGLRKVFVAIVVVASASLERRDVGIELLGVRYRG